MNHLSHDALWSYARKEFTTAERAVVKVHLEECAECRATLEDVTVATSLLASLPEVPPMPQDLARRVGESLGSTLDPTAAKGFRNWWANLLTPRLVFACGFAALVAIGAAFTFTRDEAPQPAPVAEQVPTPAPAPAPKLPEAAAPLEATVASAKNSTTEKSAKLGEGSTVSTSAGGRVWMKLPDGSRAGLTGSSELKLSTLKAKEVTLDITRGSLAMVVPHREDRVLLVRAGDVTVRDLGTRFLVQIEEGRTMVAVDEGEVAVNTPAGERTIKAGRALSWSNGELTEVDWEPMPAPAQQPVQPARVSPAPAPQPEKESIAKLRDEEDEADLETDDSDEFDAVPLPPQVAPPVNPALAPAPVPPNMKTFSLKKADRKLRWAGAKLSSRHAREAQVAYIVLSADAGDCEYVLSLADKWLRAPVTRLKNEPQLMRVVRTQEVRCLNALGRTNEATALQRQLLPQ